MMSGVSWKSKNKSTTRLVTTLESWDRTGGRLVSRASKHRGGGRGARLPLVVVVAWPGSWPLEWPGGCCRV